MKRVLKIQTPLAHVISLKLYQVSKILKSRKYLLRLSTIELGRKQYELQMKSRDRRSIAKMTINGQYVQVVYGGDFRMHKRSRLYNRCVQVNNNIIDEFERIVEIDILENKYKVYNLVKTIYQVNSVRGYNTTSSSNRSIKQLYSRAELKNAQ